MIATDSHIQSHGTTLICETFAK